jgi:NAD-dependent DNA ligase
MKKETFNKKYSTNFANARNLVSGIVGQKSIDEIKYKDVDFVAYEVIQPELTPSNQMAMLSEQDVDVVINETVSEISNEILSQLLVKWRSSYIYEIDGIICTDDQIYARTDGNPSHAFAFKMVLSDQIAEAKVLNVLWAPSKDGYLKPRIQIEPVNLGGVKIEYATAFNAAFVEDNKLGIGALVKMVRSGDVIPYIQEVVEPATKAKMPSEPYVWNSTHVDIMLENPEENEIVRQKNILAFMTKLGVDGLGPGNIKKIITAGYDSIPKILAMTPEDFVKVENFKEKMATKVYNSIHEKLNEASLIDLMVATNIFGRGLGEKKMEPIIQTYPDIIISQESREEKLKKVLSIKGMAAKSANLFVDNIKPFVEFMQEANLEDKLYEGSKKTPADTSGEFYQKKVVMTGFRDKDILDFLKKQGADIMATVSKNTALVIVKSEDDMTGKAEMAASLNIPIMTKDAFVAKYMV